MYVHVYQLYTIYIYIYNIYIHIYIYMCVCVCVCVCARAIYIYIYIHVYIYSKMVDTPNTTPVGGWLVGLLCRRWLIAVVNYVQDIYIYILYMYISFQHHTLSGYVRDDLTAHSHVPAHSQQMATLADSWWWSAHAFCRLNTSHCAPHLPHTPDLYLPLPRPAYTSDWPLTSTDGHCSGGQQTRCASLNYHKN